MLKRSIAIVIMLFILGSLSSGIIESLGILHEFTEMKAKKNREGDPLYQVIQSMK